MTALSAMLDELMGKNRNAAPNEKVNELHWSDEDVNILVFYPVASLLTTCFLCNWKTCEMLLDIVYSLYYYLNPFSWFVLLKYIKIYFIYLRCSYQMISSQSKKHQITPKKTNMHHLSLFYLPQIL